MPCGHPPAILRPAGSQDTGPEAGFLADALASLSLQQADPRREAGGGSQGFPQLLGDFEQWLQEENAKLVRVIARRTATAEDARTREMKLQVRAGKGPFPRCLHHGWLKKFFH